ncbi:MAG: FAD binding domain-containing protein, partial [Lachnospiraceae bacterium]|nr:FAD binding domain-containing protein [Lachnospiraceae bacterium]
MKQFTWHAPKTTREAVDLLSKHKKSVAVVSGGTDIVIELNERTISPEHVVDLSQVGELKYVKTEKGVMHIGARTTFSELEDLKTVREKIPALYEMASHVGSPQ